MERDIQIKLIIEGKEAIATLSNVDELYRNIVEQTKSTKKLPALVDKQDIQNIGSINQLFAQTGFLLSDLDMMFVNTRMGLLSISNNISMIAQTAANASNQAKQLGISFMQAISSSINPMNMLILGINGVMFVMQMLARESDNTTSSLKRQKDEVNNLKNEYENLTLTQLKNLKAEVETELLKMTRELSEKYGIKSALVKTHPVLQFADWLGIWSPSEMSEEERKKYESLLNQNKALDETIAKHGYIKELEAQRNIWMEKRKELDEEHMHAFDKVIQYYDKLIEKANDALKIEKERYTTIQDIGKVFDKIIRLELEKQYYETEKEFENLQILENVSIFPANLENFPSALKKLRYISLETGKPETLKEEEERKSKESKLKSPHEMMKEYLSQPEQVEEMQNLINYSQQLGFIWQRTGSIIANALSRAIIYGQKFRDIIKDLGASLLDTAIQLMVKVGLNALASELGLPVNFMASGGVINEPVYGIGASGRGYVLGEGGEPEMVIPFSRLNSHNYYIPKIQTIRIEPIRIDISGTATARGRDLDYNFNKRMMIKQKYY